MTLEDVATMERLWRQANDAAKSGREYDAMHRAARVAERHLARSQRLADQANKFSDDIDTLKAKIETLKEQRRAAEVASVEAWNEGVAVQTIERAARDAWLATPARQLAERLGEQWIAMERQQRGAA